MRARAFVLVMAVAVMVAGCDSGESEAEDSQPGSKRPSELRLGDAVTVGNLEVRATSVRVGTIRYEDRDLGPFLLVTCRVKNTHEGQVFDPFSPEFVRYSHYRDEFDNRHVCEYSHGRMVWLDLLLAEGTELITDVKPGEELEAVVPLDVPKADSSREFSARLYFRTSNEEVPDRWARVGPLAEYPDSPPPGAGCLKLTFSRSDIVFEDEPPAETKSD
jgi:hypothetical protein